MNSEHIILTLIGLIVLIILILIVYNYVSNRCDESSDRYEKYKNHKDYDDMYKYHLNHFNDEYFEPDYAWLNNYNLMPWWNSTRNTRNMSYDLRGDVPITPYYVGPWYNSPLI